MAAGDRIPCFWIEPTGTGRMQLRRYHWESGPRTEESLPGHPFGYHNAAVTLPGEILILRTDDGYISNDKIAPLSHRDKRWPRRCDSCDYRFVAADVWQMNQQDAWRRIDTGEVVCHTIRYAPPGALFDAFWAKWHAKNTYEDGITLDVMLPDGTAWMVDGPTAPDPSGGWTRTGDPKANPPTVSASPSILTPGYHGFLTNGVLIEV